MDAISGSRASRATQTDKDAGPEILRSFFSKICQSVTVGVTMGGFMILIVIESFGEMQFEK